MVNLYTTKNLLCTVGVFFVYSDPKCYLIYLTNSRSQSIIIFLIRLGDIKFNTFSTPCHYMCKPYMHHCMSMVNNTQHSAHLHMYSQLHLVCRSHLHRHNVGSSPHRLGAVDMVVVVRDTRHYSPLLFSVSFQDYLLSLDA